MNLYNITVGELSDTINIIFDKYLNIIKDLACLLETYGYSLNKNKIFSLHGQ